VRHTRGVARKAHAPLRSAQAGAALYMWARGEAWVTSWTAGTAPARTTAHDEAPVFSRAPQRL